LTKEVCVILPALNEEDTIGMVIDEIPMEEIERRGYNVNVIVVNNGSTDRTEEIAREKGAQVVCEPRRGKRSTSGTGVSSGQERLGNLW
jgi:glycosyltransferase involved in cell wall biosynthesis